MTQYRCSCCNEIKDRKNAVYREWNQKDKKQDAAIVVICRKCNALMRKTGYRGVMQFKQYAGEP